MKNYIIAIFHLLFSRDWLIGLLFLGVGAFLGYDALHHDGTKRNFFSLYHNEFAPAVMLACGHGFVDVSEKDVAGLSAFLWYHPQKRVNTFDCNAIPDNVSTRQLDGFQRMHTHLLVAVAEWWRIFGVAWDHLFPLLGFFHGITAMVAYFLFRVHFHKIIAIAGAAAITTIHDIYWQVLSFRDYGKIPFILLALLCMMLLVSRPFVRRNHFAIALSAGTVFGVGVGFRIDILVLALPMLMAFFVSSSPFWHNMASKFWSVALFIATMLVTGAPVFLTLVAGGNPSPTMYMGLANGFSQQLQVHHSLYEVEYQYHDIYLDLQIRDHAWRLNKQELGSNGENRVGGTVRAGDYFTSEYATAGEKLYHDTLLFMPADILTRMLAATKVTANSLGFGNLGIIAALLAILLVATIRPAMAFFLMFLLLILGGYPAILFKQRHYSHLVILPIWTLCFYGQILLESRLSSLPKPLWTGLARIVLLLAVFYLPLFSLLQGLRYLQDRNLRATIEKIVALERVPLPTIPVVKDGNRLLLQVEEKSPPPPNRVESRYLVMEFNSQNCPVQQLPIALRYKSTGHNLDRESLVTLPAAGMTIYTQLLENTQIQFIGVELEKSHQTCLSSLSLVRDFSHLTVVPTLTLPNNWREYSLYQTVGMATTNHLYSNFLFDTRSNGMEVPGMGL